MSQAIKVVSLTKSYGSKVALAGVSFCVPPGSIFGLIGPNGSGKTTVLSILAGLIDAGSGEVYLSSPSENVGFYSPQFGLFDYLTGREILAMFARLRDVPRAETAGRVDELLDLFDLRNAANQYLFEYSLGMRQKLGLASALIHAPAILLLDEPFEGLDASAVYLLVGVLRKLVRTGRAVLLTSHDLSLVERVCDRVGILHNGVIAKELELDTSGDRQSQPTEMEAILWNVVGTPKETELKWIS